MSNLKDVLRKATEISGEIGRLLRLSTYNDYEDLSGLSIDYGDCEQLLLLDQLRVITEKLDDAKCRIDYLNRPIKETSKLHKNESGRYETESGHYYTSGSNIEFLAKDDYHDAPYWARSRVEHCEDYYIVGFNNTLQEGLIVRVRK